MTELLQRELSRKTFLKGGGALVVGFSMAGGAVAGRAEGAVSPYASNGPYEASAIDSWIKIHADGTASVLTGRIELGQGTSVGMLQIAGEELDLDMSQLKFVVHDTNVTPDTGHNAASVSVRDVGPMVRAAAAEARKALLALASVSLGVPVANLTVSSGVVSGGGRSIGYGQLLGDKLFNVQMPASYGLTRAAVRAKTAPGLQPGMPGAKPVSQYKLVGSTPARIDIPYKVTGKFVYSHNVKVPGMLHGRVVRPRGQGAVGDGRAPNVISVDESSIKHIAGARVLRKGNFVGVVAPTEYDAIRAAAQLKVTWAEPPVISSSGNMWKQMREFDSAGQAPAQMQVNSGNVETAFKSAAQVVSQTYKLHYNDHAVIGPTCVIADVSPSGALIMTSSQDIYGVRSRVAPLLGLREDQIRIKYYEGAGAFGDHPGRYDVPLTAAVMSQLAGKPVRLQFMRWDEHGWGNYGPAMLVDMRGGIDAEGKITASDFTGFGIARSSRYPIEQQLGSREPVPGLANVNDYGGAAQVSQYSVPNRRVTTKTLPLIDNYFKTGPLRAPGWSQAAFASEQMIDELAYAAKIDPLAFRVKNFAADPGNRKLNVANALQKAANWTPKVAASKLSKAAVVAGRGIAFALNGDLSIGGKSTYAGIVADIEVNKKTGKILVTHLYAVQDVGLAINPALVENQMTGGSIQSVSRALYEAVAFNKARVTSVDWVTYPILRFKDTPRITNVVLQRTDLLSGPAGEETVPAVGPAIANAFFDATGVRIREAPMTPARVRAVLKAAGR